MLLVFLATLFGTASPTIVDRGYKPMLSSIDSDVPEFINIDPYRMSMVGVFDPIPDLSSLFTDNTSYVSTTYNDPVVQYSSSSQVYGGRKPTELPPEFSIDNIRPIFKKVGN